MLEKVLSASGVSPEDLAKSLLLQSALADKGVSGEAIANALNQLAMEGKVGLGGLVDKVAGELAGKDGVTHEDMAQAIAMAKAIEVEIYPNTEVTG